MSLLRGWLLRFIGLGCIAAILTCVAHADSTTSTTQPAKPASTTAKPTAHKTVHKNTAASRRRRSRANASWRRSQQQIKSDRAHEIQEALIREHYLKSEPSGVWDAATQNALRRYQADHGWQTKTIPDSRALIALGLGPDHEHLLNPESAMTSGLAPKNDPPVSEAKKPATGQAPDSPAPVPSATEPPSDSVQPATVQQ